MTKGVLGNDPFQRGAASRSGDAKEEAADAKGAKKSAPAKAAKGGAKAKGPKGGARKSAPAKPPKGGKAPDAKSPARPKTPAAQVHRFEAKPDARGSANGSDSRHGASVPDEATTPLREPSTPQASEEPRAARPQLLADEVRTRRPEERAVDRAMTEALASDAAEVAAKAAVNEHFQAHPGPNRDIERVLATELVAEMAETAVRQVLDGGDGTPAEREIATAVATQVAEATAGVAMDEVLDNHAAPEERAIGTAEDFEPDEADESNTWVDNAWHRDPEDAPAAIGAEADSWIDNAWHRDPEEASAPDDTDGEDLPDGVERVVRDGVHISVSVIEGAAPTDVEPEVELPDESHDELPHTHRRPLTLVTEAPDGGRASEPEPSYAGPEEAPPPSGFAGRAAGMFSLAKEIAGQALASEGLGRAVGAMHGLVEVVRTSLGTGGGSRLDDYGKDSGLVENLQPVLDFLYEQYWRVSVEGVDQVPRGASILVANHSGALPYDGLVMAQALLRERPDLQEARWLVEDQVFHAPMLGTLFNRLGAVRASPENALRLLDERRPLVVFPEGYQGASKPFAERYRLKRFGRGGFVKLALRTGAPIVPVAIVGAEETSPLLGRIPGGFLGFPSLPLTAPGPLPAKWTIRFGEPLTMDGLPPEAADDLGEVQRLTERTRESIQAMLQALLRERRSVFTG
jgi:1-acyl-sn-glycerol-3-phosphate acyltransferase